MINWRLRKVLAEKEIDQFGLIIETADALGVKPSTVRNVFTGHKTSKRIEEYLASRLGTSRDHLFAGSKHRRILPTKN
jgi:hypothetical protein